MERRTFMKGLTASLAGLGLLPDLTEGLSDRLSDLSRRLLDAPDERRVWGLVQREFQLNPGLVHLNTGSVGAVPGLVLDAVCESMRQIEGDPVNNTWGGIGAGMEAARNTAAEFLGADLGEVAFTRNTTEGMNAVASGLDLKSGDQVLTTNHEHGGGMECWQHLRKYRGVELVYLKMPNPVRDKAQILELVADHLTPRTRACSFCHIDTITGLQMPLADISQLTRPREILLVCDGAQAPGMLDVDVKALGVDTYASSSHKWLLAPKGSGLLYIRKEAQDRVHPPQLHDGYRSYTASGGTRNVPGILGHGVALDFHNTIGRQRVEARCRQLSAYGRRRFAEIPALHPLTPEQPELCGGVVSYALDRGRNGQIVSQLYDQHHIAIKPAQGTYAYEPDQDVPRESYNAVRISTHIYNSERDLDRTADALADLLARA